MTYRDTVLALAPEAYWSFSETSGLVFADLTGHGWNITRPVDAYHSCGIAPLIPGLDSAAANTDTFYGGFGPDNTSVAAWLDGGGGTLKAHAFCGWIQKEDYPSGAYWSMLYSGSYTLNFFINSSGRLCITTEYYHNPQNVQTTALVPLHKPVFVSYTYDGDRTFVVGIDDHHETFVLAAKPLLRTGASNCFCNLSWGNGHALNGVFDEFAFFTYALHPDALDTIYAAGLPQYFATGFTMPALPVPVARLSLPVAAPVVDALFINTRRLAIHYVRTPVHRAH